jgi:hypothetical protein
MTAQLAYNQTEVESSQSQGGLELVETCLTGTVFEHLYPFARDIVGLDLLAPQPHHEMCEFIEGSVTPLFNKWRVLQQLRSMMATPRGTFKSSLVVALILWLIVQFPNIRILIDSFSTRFSKSLLYDVKWHMEFNEKFKDLFGDLRAGTRKWAEDSIIVNTRTIGKKEGTVDIGGVDSPRTGGHYDVVLVDDLLNEKTALTRHGLLKSRRHVNTLTPILERSGCILYTFTRWDYRDCYGKMLDDDAKLLRSGGKPTYQRKLIRGVYLPDGRLFAPTLYPESTIAQLRNSLTDKEFSVWFLNEPIEEGYKVFPKSIIHFYKGEYVFDAIPFISVEVPQ